MVRTQIQLDEEQARWLKAEANARGISQSQLIREGLSYYREREERLPKEKKLKALQAVGRFASGVSDISEHHDDYLPEAIQSGED
jgi:Arc/MetJ-type ribon-helix-helix transcriptional regulator